MHLDRAADGVDHVSDTDLVGCPLCGNEVSAEDAADIEDGMEVDNRTCPACGMNYWEVREVHGLT